MNIIKLTAVGQSIQILDLLKQHHLRMFVKHGKLNLPTTDSKQNVSKKQI
jgi:hypothetical protein